MRKELLFRIISSPLLETIIKEQHEDLSKSELEFALKRININNIPDSILCNSREILKEVDITRLNKKKLLRIIQREESLLKDIDIQKRDYKIEEISFLLKNRPYLVKDFNIDIEDLSKKEAVALLCTGNEYFLENINVQQYEFNNTEKFNILKAFNFADRIMDAVDTSDLSEFHLYKIVLELKQKALKRININELSPSYILKIYPRWNNVLNYYNEDNFKSADIFYTIDLITRTKNKNYFHLLHNRKDEITPLGWERLIVFDEKFLEECQRLERSNINNIIRNKPSLEPQLKQKF